MQWWSSRSSIASTPRSRVVSQHSGANSPGPETNTPHIHILPAQESGPIALLPRAQGATAKADDQGRTPGSPGNSSSLAWMWAESLIEVRLGWNVDAKRHGPNWAFRLPVGVSLAAAQDRKNVDFTAGTRYGSPTGVEAGMPAKGMPGPDRWTWSCPGVAGAAMEMKGGTAQTTHGRKTRGQRPRRVAAYLRHQPIYITLNVRMGGVELVIPCLTR